MNSLSFALLIWMSVVGARAAPPCAGTPASTGAFVVVERGTKADTIVRLTICLVSDPARPRLAGYHGELLLPRTHRVIKVERPAGGTRVENSTVAGRVSFAGVAADGLAPGPLLIVTVTRHGTANDASIRLVMLGLTDVSGRDAAAHVRVDSLPRLMVGK